MTKRHTPESFFAIVPVREPGKCWLWPEDRRVNHDGYGQVMYQGRVWQAHVLAYILVKGPVPVGHETDHTCRVRRCINPEHIEAVTHLENVQRIPLHYNTAKSHCPKGHVYTEANTYRVYGRRRCKACHAEKERIRREYQYD